MFLLRGLQFFAELRHLSLAYARAPARLEWAARKFAEIPSGVNNWVVLGQFRHFLAVNAHSSFAKKLLMAAPQKHLALSSYEHVIG